MLGALKIFTSSAHARTNYIIERLNHTLCQMLSHLIVDSQTNWDKLLLHGIAVHNNSVSSGTGLGPNKVHIGRYRRLPMTVLEGRGVRGHQGLRRDQMVFLTHATKVEKGVEVSGERRFLDQGEAPGC